MTPKTVHWSYYSFGEWRGHGMYYDFNVVYFAVKFEWRTNTHLGK